MYVDHSKKKKNVENIVLTVFLCKQQTFNLELDMVNQPSYTELKFIKGSAALFWLNLLPPFFFSSNPSWCLDMWQALG